MISFIIPGSGKDPKVVSYGVETFPSIDPVTGWEGKGEITTDGSCHIIPYFAVPYHIVLNLTLP